MSKNEKLLAKALKSQKNFKFSDALKLAEIHGFELSRVRGSHHIFKHEELDNLVNLQERNGEAKPYQLKQILDLIEDHNLKIR